MTLWADGQSQAGEAFVRLCPGAQHFAVRGALAKRFKVQIFLYLLIKESSLNYDRSLEAQKLETQ